MRFEFKIIFIAREGRLWEMKPRWMGLDEAEPLLNDGLKSNYVSRAPGPRKFEIILTYGETRGIPHFRKNGEVKILVSGGGFNPFLRGKIWEGSLKYELDEEKMLKSWAEAGYPLEWNPKGRLLPTPFLDDTDDT